MVILAASLLACGCDRRTGRQTIKLGHGLPESHPVHKAMLHMADSVRERSGGQLTIDVYPSGQLGSERECLELLQIGSLGMTKVSAAVMEGFAPSYKVFNLPYLFEDDAHRFAVMEGAIGHEILADGETYWLRGLCYYDAGWRSFYSVAKPIRAPDDLKGMNIRVQESPTAVAMISAMGGSPTPMAWGELYTALQQGTVDGAENNPPSFHLSRHYEVCKYYSINQHTAVPDVLVISTKVWDRLSEQEQRWLQESADESARYQAKLWKEASDEAMAAVEKAGVQIIHPDKRPFARSVKGLDELYRSEKPVYDLIGRIRAAGSKGAE